MKTIYVEGIPKSWDVHKLKEICEQYAETKKVKISRNLGNKSKDFGFISFPTRGAAVACVEGMNKLRYGGNVKVISLDVSFVFFISQIASLRINFGVRLKLILQGLLFKCSC